MKWKYLLLVLLPGIVHCSPLIEAKAGYFFFTDSTMREVFDDGGIDLQLSAVIPVYNIWNVYVSGEYLHKSGKSIHAKQKTSIWEAPVSLGLQPVFCFKWAQYYITVGPRYFFVHVHNRSSFVPKRMHSDGIGFFANTGLRILKGKHMTFDIFGEYSYGRLHFHSSMPGTKAHTKQIGGVTFGAGLGYSF